MTRPRSRPTRSRSRPDLDPDPALPPRARRRGLLPALPFSRSGREGVPVPPPPPFSRPVREDARAAPPRGFEGRTRRGGGEPVLRRRHHAGFRGDYSVGDAPRRPSHMIVAGSREEAFEAARSLRTHDFAFVRRSDGSYSYAILAYRFARPVAGNKDRATEECLVFVTSEAGEVKAVSEGRWSDGCVRRVASREGPRGRADASAAVSSPAATNADREASCQEIKPYGELPTLLQEADPGGDDDDAPLSAMTLLPQDEERSMFSSVSDKARAAPRP